MKTPKIIAGAAVLNENSHVFLMQSSGKFGDQWIIPGGKVSYGEPAVEALRRELLEETALRISQIEFLGYRELLEVERHFVCLEFVAFASSQQQVVLNEEAVEWRWCSKADLEGMIVAPLTMALIEGHLIGRDLLK